MYKDPIEQFGGVHKPGAELCRFATAPGRRFAPVGSIAVGPVQQLFKFSPGW